MPGCCMILNFTASGTKPEKAFNMSGVRITESMVAKNVSKNASLKN